MQVQHRNLNTEEIESILILELMKGSKNHHNKKKRLEFKQEFCCRIDSEAQS